MENVSGIVSAIISLVIFLACVAGLVFSIVIHSAIMIFVTVLLAGVFGFFVYADYVKFFGKK